MKNIMRKELPEIPYASSCSRLGLRQSARRLRAESRDWARYSAIEKNRRAVFYGQCAFVGIIVGLSLLARLVFLLF